MGLLEATFDNATDARQIAGQSDMSQYLAITLLEGLSTEGSK